VGDWHRAHRQPEQAQEVHLHPRPDRGPGC
jgi:hypothetical protein